VNNSGNYLFPVEILKWNIGHRSNKHRKYKNFRIDLSFVFQNGVFILRHFLHQYLENVFKYYFLKNG